MALPFRWRLLVPQKIWNLEGWRQEQLAALHHPCHHLPEISGKLGRVASVQCLLMQARTFRRAHSEELPKGVAPQDCQRMLTDWSKSHSAPMSLKECASSQCCDLLNELLLFTVQTKNLCHEYQIMLLCRALKLVGASSRSY